MKETLFIPEGFVYRCHALTDHRTEFHLVLEGGYPRYNNDTYYEDILYINEKGLTIKNSNVEHSVESFLVALERKKIFLLSNYLFDHFKDFIEQLILKKVSAISIILYLIRFFKQRCNLNR